MSRILTFQVDDDVADQIENAAQNLGLTKSELIRTSLSSYLDARIQSARNTLLSRLKPFLTETNGDNTVADENIQIIETVLDGMNLDGLETWGNRELVSDEVFEQFVKAKIAAAGKEKTPA